MSGKPTVATVPPSFTVRLAAMGNEVWVQTGSALEAGGSKFVFLANSAPSLVSE
jgi:hypothetical protein